jgi:hypothetical protein
MPLGTHRLAVNRWTVTVRVTLVTPHGPDDFLLR